MVLIPSSRLSAADRAAWDRLERYDALLAADPALHRLAEQGRAAIRQWATAGAGVASTSWGKDSVVMAHLVATSGVDVPLVWVRSDPFEMPECEQVRDAFLAAHPQVRYQERVAVLRNPKRGEVGHDAHVLDPSSRSQDVLGELIPERYVSGVRAEESRVRAISVGRRGLVTDRTCRPMARWSAQQVFAYLHREGLPVHPAYAASVGGRFDRRWLRVHPLCSTPPARSSVHGWDMAGWEDRYWPDVIARGIASRAHLWASGAAGVS